MFTGWIHHQHKLNRRVLDDETASRLDPKLRSPVLPDHRANILRMNSVYSEFIDNRYFRRGVPALIGGVAFLILAVLPLACASPLLEKWWIAGATVGEALLVLSLETLGLFAAILFWKLAVMRDIRTYTYYPIRFNRKTREIYVFHHNGDGGVITIPWDKAFFFIGRGKGDEKHLLELRCHALNGHDRVISTFGVGHHETSVGGVLELWEMIRLYMEEGPQFVPQYPVLSFPQRVTWKESWLEIASQLGGSDMLMMVLTSPFWAVGTAMHYLTLRTCKAPIWPQEVEDACRFEPDDPYILPEERYESSHPRCKEIWAAADESRRRNCEVREAWEREQQLAR